MGRHRDSPPRGGKYGGPLMINGGLSPGQPPRKDGFGSSATEPFLIAPALFSECRWERRSPCQECFVFDGSHLRAHYIGDTSSLRAPGLGLGLGLGLLGESVQINRKTSDHQIDGGVNHTNEVNEDPKIF